MKSGATPRQDHLRIDGSRRDGQGVEISLAGPLSHDTAPGLADRLKQTWIDHGAGDLVLDFANVTKLDSKGIGVLAALYKPVVERGRTLTIRGASEPIVRVLRLVHFDRLFRFG